MERVVPVDRAGRLVIPKELRILHNLRQGSRLRIHARRGRIVLEPVDEEPAVVEQEGLLLAAGHLEGPPGDHLALREERLDRLG